MAKHPAVAFFVAAILVGIRVSASPQAVERESFKGLPGVRVLVERPSEDALRDGLTGDAIRTDVELRLRQSEIRVFSIEDRNRSGPASPYIYVNINARKDVNGLYAYSIHVELCQNVLSVVSDQVLVGVTTWSTGSVGTVGAANIRQVRESVKDHVDEFINEWLAANQK